MTWSLLPRGEDTRSPREPTQRLLRTKPKGPGREGRQQGRPGDGQGLDEDMASGLRADRWPDRGYGTCKLREAGTNGPECCVAGREGNDRRRRQGQGAAGARGSRAGLGPRAFLWEDGSHQWLTVRVVRCPSLLKAPWPLCGQRTVGEQGQKPRGELGGGDNRQGAKPGMAGRRRVFSERRASFRRGPPCPWEGSWVSGL